MAKIELIDALSIPGSPERENDDAMGHNAFIGFVLDGVTSLSDTPLLPGRSDAAWVSRLARELLLRAPASLAGDLRGLVRNVAEGITTAFEVQRARPPSGRHELPWATLSLVSVEPGRLNMAYVGDSRILIETHDDHVHNIGTTPSRGAFEARLAQKMLSQGKGIGVDALRQTVAHELRQAREIVNTPHGYWLLGADVQVADHLASTSLALDGPAIALLATDGFYALVEDYKAFDDRELLATAQTIGLQALATQLRRIENDDPMGQRYPRMKTSDDATALLVRVEP
jgi:serine/threonine protein phosphatase PrpC